METLYFALNRSLILTVKIYSDRISYSYWAEENKYYAMCEEYAHNIITQSGTFMFMVNDEDLNGCFSEQIPFDITGRSLYDIACDKEIIKYACKYPIGESIDTIEAMNICNNTKSARNFMK